MKKRNEPRNFEGVRRVKEHKKAETHRETEERRGKTTGCGSHSCHHRLHCSSQSPLTAPSSSKNRRRDREVRGRKIQRNRGLRLCTGEKKTNCSKHPLPASLPRQQPLRHLQRRQQQLPPQKQKNDQRVEEGIKQGVGGRMGQKNNAEKKKKDHRLELVSSRHHSSTATMQHCHCQ